MQEHVATEVRVTRKELVAALARQHDLQPGVANRSAEHEFRDSMRVGERPLGVVNRSGKVVGKVAGTHVDATELRARQLRLVLREGRLVVVRVIEGQGERANRTRGQPRCKPEHGARVDAAAEIAGDRHVSSQPHAHGILERVVHLADPHVVICGLLALLPLGIVPVPVLRHMDTVAVGHQVATWRQLAYAGEQRLLGRMRDEMDVVERCAVPLEGHPQRRQSLDLRGEVEGAVVESVVERLDAKAITGGKELSRPFVPNGKRELTAQRMHRLGTEILVEVQRDLAVGPRAEDVTALLQPGSDLLEVVELAVGDETQRVILGGNRLIAGREIDDAQPRMAQADAAVPRHPHVLRVRPAVAQA